MKKHYRYPEDWPDIARHIKEAAQWRCQECGLECIKPGQDTKGLSHREIARHRLAVHHQNYRPEDNRPENRIALCSACHLAKHQRRRGSVTEDQLELVFPTPVTAA